MIIPQNIVAGYSQNDEIYDARQREKERNRKGTKEISTCWRISGIIKIVSKNMHPYAHLCKSILKFVKKMTIRGNSDGSKKC